MPEKITKISESYVNSIYVIGGAWVFLCVMGGIFLKYGHSLLKGVEKEVVHAKELNANELKSVGDSIDEIKKTQDHLRELHEDHYEFEKKIGPKFSELKNEVKNVVKDFDRLQVSCDNNHKVVK